jgi:hypothetical protein
MTAREPCTHLTVGTVHAGALDGKPSPHCSVTTCNDCAPASQRFVERQTGLPASELLTYEEARKWSTFIPSTGERSIPDADAACESEDCLRRVTHNVDGDQLCDECYQEHWAGK